MNFFKFTLVVFLSMILNSILYAGPGDTIMVQTFTYEGYPVGEGWLAPREGYFDFSEVDNLDLAKVFIHYNLKCDNSQSPACGEWDYLSYIKVMERMGYGFHPSFIIGGYGGTSPDEFSYMNEVSWKYQPRFEETIVYDDPNAMTEHQIGSSGSDLSHPFNASASDSRTFYLFRADELTAAGLSAGDITGLQFNINTMGDEMQRLNIRIKSTAEEELVDYVEDADFITVYSKDTEITSTGWHTFSFTEFFDWDGSSNIIVDINFSSDLGNAATTVNGSAYSWNCCLTSSENDYCYNFNGPDMIDLPVDNLSEIEDEITISFWLNGNEEQPQNDAVFEGKSADNKRIVNVHLPWSNGRIYWDAGIAAAYDRIDKEADSPDQYRGNWNHWAFTKKAPLGQMKIFLNGEEWHSSTGKFLPIGDIDSLLIGKNIAGNNYDGKIDEFQIWSKALEAETIAAWMYKDIDQTHPDYEFLKAYYQFNDMENLEIQDMVTNQMANIQGIPQLLDYNGQRVKGFEAIQERPQIKFNRNNSNYTITSEIVVDSFPNGQTQLQIYVQDAPGETPYLDQELFVYPSYYNNYVYDENLVAIDSTLVPIDATLILEMLQFNTTEPGVEVTVPWEIGRFITPYGNNLSLGNDGWTWVYDVTDFQHLLQGDSVYIKAGNFQELLDMKFYFVEGTPPRDVLEIKNLYSKNPGLNVFDEIIVDTLVDLLPEAKMFSLKTTITGHGFGSGNNCGEFCSNIHKVEVNGNEEFSWDIMQECGENALFPQGGTWFYDRAGWCPGMPGKQQNFDLTPFINVGNDEDVLIDYDIEWDPDGNYVTEIFMVSYDEPNFQNDASIEEIIAPNVFKDYGRFNPICGNPIVRIKNTGSNTLTELTITYGIEGMNQYNYEWSGSLEFLQEEIVQLPTMNLEDFQESNELKFNVEISSSTDEYEHNNTNSANFELAPIHDQQMIVHFKTNKRPWENNYEILDTDGNVVFERGDFEVSTLHIDTLNIEPGCYEFIAYDSEGDGMYDWPSGYGTGYIKFYDMEGNLVANLEEWFGEYMRYNYINTAYPVKIDELSSATFNIFPNPSDGLFNLELFTNAGKYNISIYNTTGSLMKQIQLKSNAPGIYPIDLSELNNGFYVINVASGEFNMFKKIMIEK